MLRWFESIFSHHFNLIFLIIEAGVAQLVEQLICNQQVGGSSPSTSSKVHMGEFQSGQMGQTVNLLSLTSVVRIHLPPPKKRVQICALFCFVRKTKKARIRANLKSHVS